MGRSDGPGLRAADGRAAEPAAGPAVEPAARQGTRLRHEALLALLRKGVTDVPDLADALAVSPSTVRRDLARLTKDNKVARTYGGAVVPEAFQERPVAESALVRRQAKDDIAAAAQSLLPSSGAVFVDAGTTCAALARRLAHSTPATTRTLVVTRGLETAAALAESPGLDVVMLGGSVRRLSHGMVGPLTDLALDRMSFALAFLGADAVDPCRGVGEPTLEETAVKERVAARSDRVAVLADATKLKVGDAPAWARLSGGWTLVTDAEAPLELEGRCAEQGVTLLRAESRRA
ncbi:DeoR/GlpR family DNA-binding transcription regulator [Streptomyces sp. N2-109]|uniref:DeoR/GlpR family DNA-binding transcription regulator n=1 Tax=Streptomyces gossypii TaxID=2883101 RepID=A0ABT2JLW9_9ACTN|nr:DeoR/GlpR family DNA-binding transcription regulator [Streptomyces gossypii]MCT2588878.1 DeoR/GlpR family DNA-binding transcription regulator [Streptomyces gossypii]